MHSTTSIASPHSCYYHYYYPVPNSLLKSHFPITKNIPTKSKTLNPKPPKIHCINPNTTTTTIISKEQDKNLNPDKFRDFYPSPKTQKPHFREILEDPTFHSDILSNMWWADLKAAIGQRINIEGITSSVNIISKDKHLVIPHAKVPDIRYIDWDEMKKIGFKGVVFDKDNTLTVPYSLRLWEPLELSVERCKSLFGDNVAVFSNSAGLCEYDPDGGKAKALEDAIGIKVIRHRMKKPAGSAEEIEKHFGCESSQLIMVGDRPFTDIVYGNRNGFFTILTDPLSLKEEPLIVRQVRLFEVALVERWSRSGLKPTSHNLIPDPADCVKDVPFS